MILQMLKLDMSRQQKNLSDLMTFKLEKVYPQGM